MRLLAPLLLLLTVVAGGNIEALYNWPPLTRTCRQRWLHTLQSRHAWAQPRPRVGQLYCRTGNHLQITPDGHINGTKLSAINGVLVLEVAAMGLVTIRGQATGYYVCMNSAGRLYAESRWQHKAECVFRESMLANHYTNYASCAYPNARRTRAHGRRWHIAIKRNGRPKRGRKTQRHQKAAQFLFVPAGAQRRPSTLFASAHRRVNNRLIDLLVSGKERHSQERADSASGGAPTPAHNAVDTPLSNQHRRRDSPLAREVSAALSQALSLGAQRASRRNSLNSFTHFYM